MTTRTWTLTPGRMLAAAGVSLALALAGCADSNPDEEVRAGRTTATTGSTVVTTVPSGQTSTAPAPGPTPTPGPAPTSPPADEDPSPTTTIPGDRGQPHRWEDYTVGADGATLTFTYYAGVEPCSVFDSIVADEGADSVRVTIYEKAAGGETMCIMIAQLKSATVTLTAPLGGRTVIDGAV